MLTGPKRPPLSLLIAAGVLIGVIGFVLWRWSRFNDVWVVSGLPGKIEVSLDGKTYPVATQTKFEDVPAGTHLIEARANGVELERQMIYVRGGNKALVYNVGGTAPLLWERIAYSTYSSGSEPQWKIYCGSRFIELDDPDYLFTTPPSSISTKGGGTIYKTHVALEQGGLKACQSWAFDRGTPQMWAEWSLLEAKLDPSKGYDAAEELARQGDFREAQRLLESVKEPSLEMRNLYLNMLLESGQLAKAKELFAHAVDDPAARDVDLYFSSKLLPLGERLPFLQEARKRYPDSPYVAWGLARTLDRAGRTSEALPLLNLQGVSWPKFLEWWALRGQLAFLLRLNRGAAAWDLASQAFGGTDHIESAVLLARVAQVTGHTADWSGKLSPGALRWANTLLDLPVAEPKKGAKDYDPEALRKARGLIKVALGAPPPPAAPPPAPPKKGKKPAAPAPLPVPQSPPAAALAMARSSNDATLRVLPDTLVWALLAEAWRVGDGGAAAKLSRVAVSTRHESVLKLITTGETDVLLDDENDEVLSVLWMARGRRLATLGQSPRAAYVEAKRLDPFGGLAAKLLEAWPEATAAQGKLVFEPIN